MMNIPFDTLHPYKKEKISRADECSAYYTKFLEHFEFFQPSDLVGLERYWTYYMMKRNLPATGMKMTGTMKFICKGSAKLFVNDPLGQHISAFITEGHFCSSVFDFTQHLKSAATVTTIEPIYGMEITFEKYQLLLKERPIFAKFFKVLLQEESDYFKKRVTEFQSLNALARYQLLMAGIPQAFHRFKVRDISSYLGIQPETLSRIRLAESQKNIPLRKNKASHTFI